MRTLTIVPLVLLLALPAAAAEIHSNFTAIQGGGVFVGGPGVPTPPLAPTQEAMPFPVTAPAGATGYVLTAVEVAVEWAGYGPNLVRVSVFDDAGGEPGAELDGTEVSGTTVEPTVAWAALDGGVFLEGGRRYWVVLYGVDDSEFAWAPGDPATYSGENVYRDPVADGPWIKPPGDLDLAFRVHGTPDDIVPAAATAWGAVKAVFR